MYRHQNRYWPRFGQDNGNKNIQKLQNLMNFEYSETNIFQQELFLDQGPRSSIKWFLGPPIRLGWWAKTLHGSKLALGQVLAIFSCTALFQNYPKSYENEGFRWNLKLGLRATKKRWPKANMRWKSEAFGQKMSLWPTLAYKAHEKGSRPRFGHIVKITVILPCELHFPGHYGCKKI